MYLQFYIHMSIKPFLLVDWLLVGCADLLNLTFNCISVTSCLLQTEQKFSRPQAGYNIIIKF